MLWPASGAAEPVDLLPGGPSLCTATSGDASGPVASVTVEANVVQAAAQGPAFSTETSVAHVRYEFTPRASFPATIVADATWSGIIRGFGGGDLIYGAVHVSLTLRDETADVDLETIVLEDLKEKGEPLTAVTRVVASNPFEPAPSFQPLDLVAGREYSVTLRLAASAKGLGGLSDFAADGGRATLSCMLVTPDLVDSDGDGLYDVWETVGVDVDGDGEIDLDLPAFGADPDHKDLFVELDWVNGQAPSQAEIQKWKAAFAAAPIDAGGVPNPDGLPGINLWIDTGSLTDPDGNEDGVGTGTCGDGVDNGLDGDIDAADPDCLVGDDFGGGNGAAGPAGCLDDDFYDFKAANFDLTRQLVFRYAISGDPADSDPCGGGRGERGGNDFIEFNHDAGTLMHELGHNLDLGHGGFENLNCKPSYVSVMNYDHQFGIPQVSGGSIIDYSPPRFAGGRGVAPLQTIDETSLSEGLVFDATDPANMIIFTDPTGAKVQSPLHGDIDGDGVADGVDWNSDGDTDDAGLAINVDTFSASGRPSRCENDDLSALAGHDDWSVIALDFRQFGDALDGPINPMDEVVPELDELLAMQEAIHTTDLVVEKTDALGPGESAIAGTPHTWTVTVSNAGPNPAYGVVVTDHLPAGVTLLDTSVDCAPAGPATLACALGDLRPWRSASFTVSVLVDADLVYDAGGPTVVTNGAQVEHQSGPDSDGSDNEVERATPVVAAADLELVSYGPLEPPAKLLVGTPQVVEVRALLTNHGPSAPMDVRVTSEATPAAGIQVQPAAVSAVAPAVGLDELRAQDAGFELTCVAPGSPSVLFEGSIEPAAAADIEVDPSDDAAAAQIDVECVVPVAINIKPGSEVNPAQRLRGTIPVALLTTRAGEYDLPVDFDATRIIPGSVRFGPADVVFAEQGGAAERHGRAHFEDALERDEVTRDGDVDAVLHFRASEAALPPGATEACIAGDWLDNGGQVRGFFGCDALTEVP